MKFGVPYIPLLVVSGFILWSITWTSILVVLLLPVVIGCMGLVTRVDDQQYRLLGLRLYCRLVQFNSNQRFWEASTYSPLNFEKRRR